VPFIAHVPVQACQLSSSAALASHFRISMTVYRYPSVVLFFLHNRVAGVSAFDFRLPRSNAGAMQVGQVIGTVHLPTTLSWPYRVVLVLSVSTESTYDARGREGVDL